MDAQDEQDKKGILCVLDIGRMTKFSRKKNGSRALPVTRAASPAGSRGVSPQDITVYTPMDLIGAFFHRRRILSYAP